MEELRRQQLAQPARLCRLPRLLQETATPVADAPVVRAVEAQRTAGSRLGRFGAALQRKRRGDSRARAGQLGMAMLC